MASPCDDINALILRELSRIAQVYKSDLEVAVKQEAGLTAVCRGLHHPFL